MTDPQLIQGRPVTIPAHDRDTWWKIGMAVKSELGGYRLAPWSD